MKKIFYKAAFLGIITTFTISCTSDDSTSKDDDNPNVGVKYVHKVLIEDATGTWCQYCPRVTYAIEQAKANEEHGSKVVAVAIHRGVQGYPDLMQIPAGVTIDNMFRSSYGLTGYPFGLVNRTEKWRTPEQNNLAQVFNSLDSEGSPVGIKISSNLTTTGGTVTADFKFSTGYENLKYSIYVIEHEVVTTQSPQQNTTNYYGSVRVDPNFIHNDVLRAVSGTATGNELGTVTVGQEVLKADQSVNFTLFNNDLSKVELIVFVTDGSGEVLNVQSTHANQNVDYETM